MPSLNIDPKLLPELVGLPAAMPPPGVVPNFINPYTLAPLSYWGGSVFVFIMICFVMARFYNKTFLAKAYTWDDFCKAGVGTHEWDLKIGQMISNEFLVDGGAFVVVTLPCMMFAKLTFFIFYVQIFRIRTHLSRWIWAGAIVTTGFYIATSIAQFYFTIPGPGQTWFDKIDLNPNSQSSIIGIVSSCFGIISDFYLFFLAVAGIWKLQIPKERKMGVIAVFATGLLACVVSVVGLVYRIKSREGSDGTYQLLPPAFLIVVELAVGVSCSCMPSVGCITRKYSKNISGLTSYWSKLRTRYGTSRSRNDQTQPKEYSSSQVTPNRSMTNARPYSVLEGREIAQLKAAPISSDRISTWELETVGHDLPHKHSLDAELLHSSSPV
ncbi:uncharacterized protein LY89DRAFT_672968 [Mollisia scopiformis]|uniref:Rhodopsin domain-containing protein n=1 Tax=Mollisia scopiformis TaxID=149040 RepID=A0A194WZ33_MOLSC|nr:uncharacterized protein LY89DRAFT_672968 [Mollisia scopiformis]KUJ12852.1 hypothetical protein LY89DRAFT_672968 [Mollisia scopiformis]